VGVVGDHPFDIKTRATALAGVWWLTHRESDRLHGTVCVPMDPDRYKLGFSAKSSNTPDYTPRFCQRAKHWY